MTLLIVQLRMQSVYKQETSSSSLATREIVKPNEKPAGFKIIALKRDNFNILVFTHAFRHKY